MQAAIPPHVVYFRFKVMGVAGETVDFRVGVAGIGAEIEKIRINSG